MKRTLAILGLCAAVPSQAATLRTMVTLQGAQVYLRDLFDDAGPNANRVLGPGPGPGGRIVVEARQLKAIANQFGVDWRPMSGADRAILDWPGRPLRQDEILGPIRRALITRGAAEDCDIDVPGYLPPLVPVSGASAPAVTQLDYDAAAGRFSAVLSVLSPGAEPIAVRVSGQVSDVIEVPVAVARLAAGAIPRPDDLRMARVHTSAISGEVARDPRRVAGMQLRRQIAPGVPIPLADLHPPTEVARGEPVRLRLQSAGLSLAGEGIALESGSAGERIRVRNISSQAVIEAEIVGPGEARVLPGSSPITAQARLGLAAARGG